MDGSNSTRKRKRPSYLDDFFESVIEETPASKKRIAANNESRQNCLLCSEVTESSGIIWDLLSTTGASKYTFSMVLNTLFKEEELSLTLPDLSEGHLCKVCKEFVSELDRLQHQVLGVKKSIMDILKKAKYVEKNGIENEDVDEKKKVEQEEKEETLEVEDIIKKRIGRGGKVEYLVKWKNYDRIEFNTWEMADGLEGAEGIIREFEEKNKPVENIKAQDSKNKVTAEKKKQTIDKTIKNNKNDLDKKKENEKQLVTNGKADKRTEESAEEVSMKPKRRRKDSILEKNGHKYLVRWDNYPEDEDSWELRSSIPADIIKRYEEGLEIMNAYVKQQSIHDKTSEKNKQIDNKNEAEIKQDRTIEKAKQINDENKEDIKKYKMIEKTKQTDAKNEEKKKQETQESKFKSKRREASKSSGAMEENKKAMVNNQNNEKNEGRKKKTSASKQEDVFNIEALVEKKGSKYLVKWENFTDDQNTWEPRSSIPPFIVKVGKTDYLL